MRVAEQHYPNMLNPTSDAPMVVASDYSGQHKGATHEAYSFLITDYTELNEWLPSLREFREKWLTDNRRISFKKLNEPTRWRALPAFLETAGRLKGNLITILVDRRVGSFMHGGPNAVIEAFPDCFSAEANHGTVEKMFRLASFVALVLASLRREGQISNWISDHDETLDSHTKREQFARLASYLTFGLTGWRMPADHIFGTTESPLAPWWSEDVAALPDIAAGMYCNISSFLPAFVGVETWSVRVGVDNIRDRRARLIGDWLNCGRSALKHVLLRLEQDPSEGIRASAQAFTGRL